MHLVELPIFDSKLKDVTEMVILVETEWRGLPTYDARCRVVNFCLTEMEVEVIFL